MSVQALTSLDIQALAAVLPHVEALMEDFKEYHCRGQLRIWNNHGYSPGYFDFDHEFPTFVVDYLDD